MNTQKLSFGKHIKHLRRSHPDRVTLNDLSKVLGISLSYLSDVEQGRKRPFDGEKLELFVRFMCLDDKASAKLYDLAGSERKMIPSDIEDIMGGGIGNLARMALRETKAGYATEEDWKQLIRIIEERKRKENH